MKKLILLLLLTSCSFDYDNHYALPNSFIGTECYNEGEVIKHTVNDWYYCAMCCESADGLMWFEVECEEMEEE
jgi:hypothetical protein